MSNWIQRLLDALDALQGGAETLESIDDELDAMLDLARSAQSGTTTTDGNEQTLYEETGDPHPFDFGGGSIDMTALTATETLRIRVYRKKKSGGNYIKKSNDTVNTYTGAQDPADKDYDRFYNTYGVKITMELLGGANKDIDHEWFDAKRGS